MCRPRLRAILSSFAGAQDRFDSLSVQPSNARLVEPSGVLDVPRAGIKNEKATLRWRFSFWRPHGDSKGDADKLTPLALVRVTAMIRRESGVNQYHQTVPLFLMKLVVNYNLKLM